MRSHLLVVLLFSLCQVCWGQQQSNIILINLDDVEENALNPVRTNLLFPNMARFHTEGMRFTNAHVTTPLCGPSRCCLLRAQYAHNTGSRVNDPYHSSGNGFDGGYRFYIEHDYHKHDLSTWMQNAGYRTMLVGKYLNNDYFEHVPNGWDDYYSSWGGAQYFNTVRFTNRSNPNGSFEQLPANKYRTEAEADDVIELISNQTDTNPNQPFFMYWAPLAAHHTFSDLGMIESRHAHFWPNLKVPRVPSFNELDISDKRGSIGTLPPISNEMAGFFDFHFRERTLAMRSVDDMIGRIFAMLEEKGLEENTYVILTSDNGWLEGHHRMYGKAAPYDRATRVPLLVWGPGVQPATANHLIAHIDICPTILDLASGVTPGWVDGESFYDVLFDPNIDARSWREPILIESWSTTRMPGLSERTDLVSTALRYYDESYIEWFNGDAEYYHFPSDPFQIRNRYDQLPNVQKHRMAAEIREIKTPMKPEVGLITPYGENDTVGRRFDLQGFAEDDGGLWNVKVAIIDQTTNRYWNGSGWQSNFVNLTTEMTNPGGQLTKWRLPIHIPNNIANENQLKLRVWAIDLLGNYRPNISRQFRLDLTAPVCQIEYPSRHQRVPQQFTMTGTFQDASEVTQVRLVVKNRDTGNYWNGDVMVANWNFHQATILQDGRWEFESLLSPGRYLVSVRGIDEHGNIASNVFVQYFVVE